MSDASSTTNEPGPSAVILVVYSQLGSVRKHTLLMNRTLSIGRTPSNDIIFDDPEVSSRHAQISLSREGVLLTDLGSTNGVFIGDVRLSAPTTLGISDHFRVVDHTISIAPIDALSTTRTREMRAPSSFQLAPSGRIVWGTAVGIPFGRPDGEHGGWLIQPLDDVLADPLIDLRSFSVKKQPEVWRKILAMQRRPYTDWPLRANRKATTYIDLSPDFGGARRGSSAHLSLMIYAWIRHFMPDGIDGLSTLWATGMLDAEEGVKGVNAVAAKTRRILSFARAHPGLHLFICPDENNYEAQEQLDAAGNDLELATITFDRTTELVSLLDSIARTRDGEQSALVVCYIFPELEELASLLDALHHFGHGLDAHHDQTTPPAHPGFDLEYVCGPESPKVLPLDPLERVTIGRAADCDLCLDISFVSRRHCSLQVDGDTLLLTNHSVNGVFLQAGRLHREQTSSIAPGVLFRVGASLFRVMRRDPVYASPTTRGAFDRVTGLSLTDHMLEHLPTESLCKITLQFDHGANSHTLEALDEAKYWAPWRLWVMQTLRAAHPGCAIIISDSTTLLVATELARGWTAHVIQEVLEQSSGRVPWLGQVHRSEWRLCFEQHEADTVTSKLLYEKIEQLEAMLASVLRKLS